MIHHRPPQPLSLDAATQRERETGYQSGVMDSEYLKNKDASSQAFRDGFVQGYDAGFRQYSGYNNGGYRRSKTRSNVGSIPGSIFGRP